MNTEHTELQAVNVTLDNIRAVLDGEITGAPQEGTLAYRVWELKRDLEEQLWMNEQYER